MSWLLIGTLMSGEEILEKAEKIANHRLGWWQNHHRKNTPAMLEDMAQEVSEQFYVSIEDARDVVALQVEAAGYHDEAERLEDAGDQDQADLNWEKCRNSLKNHFAQLIWVIQGTQRDSGTVY